jgi:hypothetical protein
VFSKRIHLVSPLSPAECASRLAAAIDPMSVAPVSLTFPPGSKPVIGNVTETSLQIRKRINYRSSFQTFLAATLRPEAGGTVIAGDVGLPPLVMAFMLAWFGFAALVGGPLFFFAAWSLLSGSNVEPAMVIFAIVPPVMLLGGIGLVLLGRNLARDEGRFLTDFVTRTLNAQAKAMTSAG